MPNGPASIPKSHRSDFLEIEKEAPFQQFGTALPDRDDRSSGIKRQLACKPGSVWLRLAPERGSHSSGTALTHCLTQPTRMTGPETGRTAFAVRVIPIRSCSRWGLPCRSCCQARGGLLPHPFTLTPPTFPSHCSRRKSRRGGLLSVALSLRSPSPDVIRHRTSVEPGLSSPYRLSALVKRGCPANWQGVNSRDCREIPIKYSPRRRDRPTGENRLQNPQRTRRP
ncbi:hypothetical protein EV286_102543 [Rhizobium sp. BK251]|nr:hypothetical protein EV286_102543 [Rhizobium sp. BK251]